MTTHQPAAETDGMFTDTRIENAIRAALRSDPRIKHPELIAVSVDEIGTVVLRGAVGSPLQRRAAAHDARQIDGVFEVIVDGLKVHPHLGELRADDEVGAEALQRVILDSRIRSSHIHVKVKHGRAKVSGYVRSESERAAAAEDVAGVAGVVEVENQIELR
jgi:osmotically-inducible protein OsmY